MSALVEFLQARLDEAEARARHALDLEPIGDDWAITYEWARITRHSSGGEGQRLMGPCLSPRDVLADIAAKRAVVESCSPDYQAALASGDDTTSLAEEVLGWLATAYDGHPDYRQEWKP